MEQGTQTPQDEVRTIYERINNEPVIFRGLSNSELKLGLIVTIIVLLPICTLLGYLMDRMLVGIGSIGIFTMLSIMYLGTFFQRIKRGRPDGFYQQRLALIMSKLGLKKLNVIKYSGSWSTGRHE